MADSIDLASEFTPPETTAEPAKPAQSADLSAEFEGPDHHERAAIVNDAAEKAHIWRGVETPEDAQRVLKQFFDPATLGGYAKSVTADTISKNWKDVQEPMVNLPQVNPDVAMQSKLSAVDPRLPALVGIYDGIAPFVSGLTSPLNVATLGSIGALQKAVKYGGPAAGLAKAALKSIETYFTADMAHKTGEAAGAASVVLEDPNASFHDKAKAVTETLASGAMTGLVATGLASKTGEAAPSLAKEFDFGSQKAARMEPAPVKDYGMIKSEAESRLAELEKKNGPRDTFNPETNKMEPGRVLFHEESTLLKSLDDLDVQNKAVQSKVETGGWESLNEKDLAYLAPNQRAIYEKWNAAGRPEGAGKLDTGKPTAPAEFLSHATDEGFPETYNLTSDIPVSDAFPNGAKAGSTVSRQQLEKAGYEVPPAPDKPNPLLEGDNFDKAWQDQGGLSGAENQVVFQDGRVFKRNYNNQLGINHPTHGNIENLKASIELHNQVFPDTALKFEGTSVTSDGPAAVVSQPEVKGVPASPQEIRDYMESKGFEPIGPNSFENKTSGIRVSDITGDNVMLDLDGNVRVIDPVIKKVEPTKPVDLAAELEPTGQVPDAGLGAASAKELEPAPSVTSTKNAVVDQERVKRGQPPVIEDLKRSFGKVWDDAMKEIDSNPSAADDIISGLKDEPRALTDTENAILLQRQVDLQNNFDRIAKRINEGQGSPVTKEMDQARLRELSDQLLEVYDAGKLGGRETGRGLNARKMLAKQDFTLANMITRRRALRNGEELTPKEIGEVTKQHEEITKAQEEVDKADVAKNEKESGDGVDLFIKDVPKGEKPKPSERTEIEDELRNATRESTDIKDLKRHVKDLAEYFVREGMTDRNKLLDAVHEVVKRDLPETTRREVMDAISDYGDFKPLDPDEVKATLRDLRGQMQQVAKLEDMQAGQAPKRTGQERRTPSDEERALIKQVEEAKRKGGFNITDPVRQLKSALDAIKTRLKNQIKDLETQIATREKILKTKTAQPSDAEVVDLKSRRDALRKEFDEIFTKPELTDAQRLKLAEAAAERQITELERQIRMQEVFPEGAKPAVSSPKLEAAKARIDALKAEREYTRELLQPKPEPLTTDEAGNKAFKAHTLRRIAELQERLATGDFSKKARTEFVKDPQSAALEAKLEIAKDAYRASLENDRYKRLSDLQKFKEQVGGTWDMARQLMTTGEASFILRQGKLTLATRPHLIVPAIKDAFRAFLENPEQAMASNIELMREPLMEQARAAKLHINKEGQPISKGEEAFLSRLGPDTNLWAQRALNKMEAIKDNRIISRISQAGEAFLNRLRFDAWKAMHDGKSMSIADSKAIARFVNQATGRGTLGAFERNSTTLSRIMFSPRYFASRLQFLTGETLWSKDTPPAARKIIAKEYVRTLVGLGAYYSLLVLGLSALSGKQPTVSGDPRSSDFAKPKVGNSRLDPLAGLQQFIVFLARSISGEKMTATGKIIPIRGEKVPYNGERWTDLAKKFAQSKAHPVLGAGAALMDQRDLAGNPADFENQALNLSAPVTFFDIADAMKDNGLPEGLALSMMAFLGEGLQTYDPSKKHNKKTAAPIPDTPVLSATP